ncbi:hypothetical protein ACTNE0_09285 [Bacillota bacterium HCP3S3_E9]
MNNSRTKRRSLPCRIKEHWSPLILFANLAAYIGFALIDGPVWCRDSNSYATMDYTREPVYPTFLWLMRKLFGENMMVHGWDLTDRLGGKAPAMEPLYLMAVIVVQSILAAVTVWLLSKLCYEISGKLRYAAAANLVMWGVDLLNRFGAKRGSTYTQSIMTEGFGVSFYILFLLSLFQYLRQHRRMELGNEVLWKRYLRLSVLMMVLCASQHKQLTVTLIIFAAAAISADLRLLIRYRSFVKKGNQAANQGGQQCCRKKETRKTALSWLCRDAAALLFAGVLIFLIGHVYNLTFHGVWSFHTGSADKIDSTLLYTVTEEDAELFASNEKAAPDDADNLRELFLSIEEELAGQQLRYVDAPSGSWVELCSHYADSYDIIGFEVLDPLVDSYVRTNQPDLIPGSMEFAIATDQVCQSLEHVLIRQNPSRLLYLWINNVRKGFVNTVLRVSTVLNWASLVLWISYLSALFLLIQREKHKSGDSFRTSEKNSCDAAEEKRCVDTILLASLVLLGTLVNCMVVGAIIFPQTRYMIYNMGLFYTALILMMGELGRGHLKALKSC